MAGRQRGRRGGPGWLALTVGVILLVVGGLALLASIGAIASVTTTMIGAAVLVGVGVIVVAWALVPARRRPTTVLVERDDATRLALTLAYGGGALTFGPAAPAGPLVSAWSDHEDIRLGVERSAGEARVRLSRDVGGWDPFGAGTWRVAAAADVPLALEVQAGAGRFDLDLAGVRLARAVLHIGAAEVRCRLPIPSGDVLVRVEAGAASVRLEVPPGAAYRTRTEGFVSRTGATTGGAYEVSTDRLTIEMTGAAASLTIA